MKTAELENLKTELPPVAADHWPDSPVECCWRFLDEVEISPRPNTKIGTSYLLKHICERASGRYIPMCALLQVARKRGVPMQRCDERSPNFWLGITALSIRAFKRKYGVTHVF